MDDKERKEGVRLACQVKVRNDMEIEIPAFLFAIQQYQAKLAAVEDLTYDMKRFRFELLGPETMDFVAGQYCNYCPPIRRGLDESAGVFECVGSKGYSFCGIDIAPSAQRDLHNVAVDY